MMGYIHILIDNEKYNEGMKQVCYIATHVHTSVCMNVGTCVCMRRVSVLLCVGAMYPRVRYDMIWCM